jgi:hypothetical protein
MWAAIIPAVASIAGSVIGGKGGKSSSSQTNEPWAAQIPYLTGGFANAQNLLNTRQNTPWYQGKLTAEFNPLEREGVDLTGGFVRSAAMPAATAMVNAGMTGLGAAGNFVKNANDTFTRAAGDKTQLLIDNAARYADNPHLQAAIDSAANDVTRNLKENILTGIDRDASSGGNLNSSRAGVAEGIASRGAAEKIADISAQARLSAWNEGLARAQSQYNTDTSAMLSANGQLGQAWELGNSSTGQGIQSGLTSANAMTAAGSRVRDWEQRGLDNDLMRWERNDQRPWDELKNYWSIVGSHDWGGSSQKTESGRGDPSAGFKLGQQIGGSIVDIVKAMKAS